MNLVLAINPGATSTKIGVFSEDGLIFKQTAEHSIESLAAYDSIFAQFPYRLDLLTKLLAANQVDISSLTAVVGRGGLLKPLPGGTYLVNEAMLADLKRGERGEHASNLGAALAFHLGRQYNLPAFIVDPVSVDELEPVARISGLSELERISLSHALNMKAVAKKTAYELGKAYENLRLIVVHLGTGISVSAHEGGRMIDVNNARDEGPFSPERCGSLPVTQLVTLCYSGKYTYQQMLSLLTQEGGLYSYLGTKDVRKVRAMARDGDGRAKLVLQALCYQVAKEIGAAAAVLCGQVDGVILTGGMAYDEEITNAIAQRIKFIAPILLQPGEEELEALAMGALRVLSGEEQAREYQ